MAALSFSWRYLILMKLGRTLSVGVGGVKHRQDMRQDHGGHGEASMLNNYQYYTTTDLKSMPFVQSNQKTF